MPYAGGVPRHWQCRSTEIPYLKTFKELGFNLDEFPEGTQWTPEGEVAGDLSFEDWLRSKSPEFVESLLGKKRTELFLDKKMTLSEFLDMSGQPMTLDAIEGGVRSLAEGLNPLRKAAPLATRIAEGLAVSAVTSKATEQAITRTYNFLSKEPIGVARSSRLQAADIDQLRALSTMPSIFEEIREVSEWLEEATGASVSMYGMGKASATAVAKEAERLHNILPEVKVEQIASNPYLDIDVVGEAHDGIRRIELNPRFFGRPRRAVEADLELWSDDRYFTPGVTALESTYTHEFGHQLLWQLRRARNRRSATARAISDPLRRMIEFLRDEGIREAGEGGLTSGLGEYAYADLTELFAESFTAINWLPEEQWTPYMRSFHDLLVEIIGERNFNALGYHGR
jgi:hypothetical protein